MYLLLTRIGGGWGASGGGGEVERVYYYVGKYVKGLKCILCIDIKNLNDIFV